MAVILTHRCASGGEYLGGMGSSQKRLGTMNIWILNHYATLPNRPGGTRHYDQATELVRLGCEVTIMASAFSHQTKEEQRPLQRGDGRTEVVNGVKFVWVKTSSYNKNDWRRLANMISYSVRVLVLGLRLKPRPDVIVASSPHPFAGLCGYALARARRAGFVYEIRDLWPEGLVEVGGYSRDSLVVRTLGALERFLYRGADRIVVLLPRASEYITNLGIPAKKIVYIPNGANPVLLQDCDGGLPAELSDLLSRLRAAGVLVVGYAGAHGTANALDPLLQAVCLLQERGVDWIHFVLVGDGPDKPRLMATARSRGLSNLRFVDPIPKRAVPEFLKRSDIGIISMCRSPLYRYGMSLNKLWDYMICAKPVVWASDVVENPVALAQCGLTVPPEEPERLADAIVEMCSMTAEQRLEMGVRGHDYVTKYHSTPVLAAELLRVLHESRNA